MIKYNTNRPEKKKLKINYKYLFFNQFESSFAFEMGQEFVN